MTELLRLVRQSVGHFLKSFILLLQLLHRRIKERSKTGGKRNNADGLFVLRNDFFLIISPLITLTKAEEDNSIVHDAALFMMAEHLCLPQNPCHIGNKTAEITYLRVFQFSHKHLTVAAGTHEKHLRRKHLHTQARPAALRKNLPWIAVGKTHSLALPHIADHIKTMLLIKKEGHTGYPHIITLNDHWKLDNIRKKERFTGLYPKVFFINLCRRLIINP